MDFRHQVNSDGQYKYLMPSRRSPEGDIMYFNEVSFDANKRYVSTFIGAYQKVQVPQKATIGRVRFTKDRSIIGVEIVKDHLYGSSLYKTVEIVLFKATLPKEFSYRGGNANATHSLMKTKITVNVERGVLYDF